MIGRFFKSRGKKESEFLDIEFVARNKFIFEACEPPKPAKNFMPDWYKDIPSHHSKKPSFVSETGNTNSTVKNCMPFFDSLTTGYIMSTPCDIIVEASFDKKTARAHANEMFDLIGERGVPGKHSMPAPDDYYQFEWTWQTHWEAHTPDGYSCLYTHPINHPELPFYTVSGIMDTDKWYLTGNHPFYIKKGFEGVIPMGTPMMSILPFKRNNWKASARPVDEMESAVLNSRVRRHAHSGYKKEMWSRKDYL